MAQGISVNIKAGSTKEDSTVSISGMEKHIITDEERNAFGIGSDDDLKSAVEKYFGKWPDYAYVRSNDMYNRYGWEEVKTELWPSSWEVLPVSTSPSIVTTETYDNTQSSKPLTCKAELSAEVKDSVSTTWSNAYSFSVGHTIKTGVDFGMIKAGGETSINFEASWGTSTTETKEFTLRASSGVSFTLNPGESAVAELISSKGVGKVRITYKAWLNGYIALYYNQPYNGHWCCAVDAGAVLRDANFVEIVEDIEVGFYTDTILKVKDKAGKLMTKNVYMATFAD